jgi:hypothetical protein
MKMKASTAMPEGKSVVAVAEEAANYFIKITAMDPQKDGVEYQVRVSEMRLAEAADRARRQGEQLFAAGEEIYERRTKEGCDERGSKCGSRLSPVHQFSGLPIAQSEAPEKEKAVSGQEIRSETATATGPRIGFGAVPFG